MRVIAISGHRKSGKDTLADQLIKNYGFKKFPIAHYLKKSISEQYGLKWEYLNDQTLKESPLKQRPLIESDRLSLFLKKYYEDELQFDSRGQLCWTPRALCLFEGNVKRIVNPDHWIKKTTEGILEYSSTRKSENVKVVIPDLRYLNEIDYLKNSFKSKLELVRVDRFRSAPSQDLSETELDTYPFKTRFSNRDSKKEFINKIEKFMEETDERS